MNNQTMRLAVEAGFLDGDLELFPETIERFSELVRLDERALAKPEQEPYCWVQSKLNQGLFYKEKPRRIHTISLYTAPPRKPWQGLTSEDWENTPDTGKQGCERDAELFDWIEQTLKDKNT